MKTNLLLLLAASSVIVLPLHASDSKRTAEYILATPSDFEGKEVTLDVAFVKPVQWKSSVPELAFFRAMTLDRRDYKPGGHILVAIPAASAGAFSKKYGMDFEGRRESNSLKGTLLTGPNRMKKNRIWFIDTSGQAQALIKDNKIALEEDGPAGLGERQGGTR